VSGGDRVEHRAIVEDGQELAQRARRPHAGASVEPGVGCLHARDQRGAVERPRVVVGRMPAKAGSRDGQRQAWRQQRQHLQLPLDARHHARPLAQRFGGSVAANASARRTQPASAASVAQPGGST
jgi:hypothetical protein